MRSFFPQYKKKNPTTKTSVFKLLTKNIKIVTKKSIQKSSYKKNVTLISTTMKRLEAESVEVKHLNGETSNVRKYDGENPRRRKDCRLKTWRWKFHLKNPLAKNLATKILHKKTYNKKTEWEKKTLKKNWLLKVRRLKKMTKNPEAESLYFDSLT